MRRLTSPDRPDDEHFSNNNDEELKLIIDQGKLLLLYLNLLLFNYIIEFSDNNVNDVLNMMIV